MLVNPSDTGETSVRTILLKILSLKDKQEIESYSSLRKRKTSRREIHYSDEYEEVEERITRKSSRRYQEKRRDRSRRTYDDYEEVNDPRRSNHSAFMSFNRANYHYFCQKKANIRENWRVSNMKATFD